MNKTLRRLILSAGILTTGQLYALGLGNIQINSALDEVLDGTIPLLIDGSEDLADLKVSIATDEDYERVNLDKSYFPSNISVDLSTDGANIELSSVGPVSEPIVSLLLVVDWANGHLLREYTILLDPPLFNNTQIEENYSQPVETQTYQQPTDFDNNSETDSDQTDTSSSGNDSTVAAEPTTTISETAYDSGNSMQKVTVESGDTLWSIANRYNNGAGTPQQMMVAIFNNNPLAFGNNDMNMLKKGAVLQIPDSEEVNMVSSRDALSEVKSQTANVSRLQSDDYGTTEDSGADTDYGIELVPPSSDDTNNSGNTSGTALQRSYDKALAELALAREELASSNQENAELASRVAELEQIVEDQRTALSLKDDNLAQLQQQLKEGNSQGDDVWDDSQSTISDVENTKIDEQIQEVMDTKTSQGENSADIANTENTQGQGTTANDDAIEITDVKSDTKPVTNKQTQPVIQQPKPKAKKGLMDTVMEYKFEGLIGLGVVLLSILGFIFFKRRNVETIDMSDTDSYNEIDEKSNEENDDLILAGDSVDDDLGLDEIDDLNLDSDEAPEVVMMNDDEDSEETQTDDLDLSGLDDISLDDLDSEMEAVSSEDLDVDSDIMLDSAEDDFNLEDDLEIGETQTNEEDQSESDQSDLEFEDIGLESDLDELTFDEDESESDEDANESEEDFSLDFDLDDLSVNDGDESENLSEPVDSDEDEKDSGEQILEEDFSLDFDMDDDETEMESVTEDSDELEEMAFDTGERSIVSESNESENTDLADLDFDFDEDLANITNDNDEEETSVEDNISDVNLDELQFDMGSDEGSSEESTGQQEEDFDLGLDFEGIGMGSDDAIDTKLDLAKAYFEMGDIEGAKQMVEEIINEGSAEQIAKAEELKSKIDD